jgi:acetyltransferase-like isoleucine patch superfamily enzyme
VTGALLRVALRLRAAASRASLDVDLARSARFGAGARFVVGRRSATRFVAGDGARIGARATVLLTGGALEVGPGALVGDGAVLETRGGTIRIERDARVGVGAVIRAGGSSISIGEGAGLQDRVVVRGEPGRAVVVGTGARVGSKATIEPGGRVSDGAEVPPHTVVREVSPSARRRAPRRSGRARTGSSAARSRTRAGRSGSGRR